MITKMISEAKSEPKPKPKPKSGEVSRPRVLDRGRLGWSVCRTGDLGSRMRLTSRTRSEAAGAAAAGAAKLWWVGDPGA